MTAIASLFAWVWSDPGLALVLYLAVGLALNVALGALDAWARGTFRWAELPRILATLKAAVVVQALIAGVGVKLMASAGLVLAVLARDPTGTAAFKMAGQLILDVLVSGATLYAAAVWNEDRLQILDLIAALAARWRLQPVPPKRNIAGVHQLGLRENPPTVVAT